ncbi:MAG: prepilin-type N-terminal cleavage/methylation domain-containing protein [Rickettsiales bacterium]|nr:prepilin-type N-terminal cleavage/methylation domain-containing protein [Rickettsiales bacterium]
MFFRFFRPFFFKRAFNLVEMTIVIAVISILITMTIVSKKFVTNARIKRAITEISDIENGARSFFDIYNALPGDFEKATDFFDNAVNGDGDDRIEYANEVYNVMMHLNAADLVMGNFQADEQNYAFRSNSTVGTVIRLIYTGVLSGFVVNNINVMQLGRANNADDASFLPYDAEYLDIKFDDSEPYSGKVTFREFGTTTAASCTNNTEKYYVASEEVGCNIVIELDFI